ncbi:hypothetical protein Glove_139g127 [Diversispora epigaea]|uniref:Uncharacterized protein n=1 Tax=Diversispora epigaea TaxID=1348612 RepID=A0A397J298_9GLOM|nr:hypothetical protein Glove_139g127 [Diversispora epigaea]
MSLNFLTSYLKIFELFNDKEDYNVIIECVWLQNNKINGTASKKPSTVSVLTKKTLKRKELDDDELPKHRNSSISSVSTTSYSSSLIDI